MSVITISRGSYSGGKMLAESVAQKLGYRCIDRDQLIMKAAQSGVSWNDLNGALKAPPSFLGVSRHVAYSYLAIIQAALLDEIRDGNAIYHGLAGHLLLRDVADVLRVRLIAPMEFRVSNVQQRLKLNRKDAIAYIESKDQGRQKWTRSLYNVDWGDASLYDVVLNLDRLTLEQARDVVCTIVQQESFQSTPERRQALNDLAMASRIRAKLASSPVTADLELEVVVHLGTVSIKGNVAQVDQGNEIERIARVYAGGKTVRLDGLKLAARL